MKSDSLARWLKVIIIGLAVWGLCIYAGILPLMGKELLLDVAGVSHYFWPWMVFLWVSAVPCYAMLVYGWKVVVNIGRDRSFCNENAYALKNISYLALCDSVYFFVGNVVLYLMDMNHPSVFLASFFVIFAGVAVAVAAAALSHLVLKAARLQEQSDLTI